MDSFSKLALVAICALSLGFAGGYFFQPEPKVEIKASLKPPFVEVYVNGRQYDAKHLKLVPEPAPKKGWWGDDNKPAAMNHGCPCGNDCKCENCKCLPHVTDAIMLQPPVEQRGDKGGNPNDFLLGGVKDIVKDLINWISGKSDEAAHAIQLREEALAAKMQWLATAAVVAAIGFAIPLWSISFSVAKLAGKS